MTRLYRIAIIVLSTWLVACATGDGKGTLASLKKVEIEVKEAKIEGGLEKAMESYQRFLEQTPETAMTPEAIRRLADLKIEQGNIQADARFERQLAAEKQTEQQAADDALAADAAKELAKPSQAPVAAGAPAMIPGIDSEDSTKPGEGPIADISDETEREFAERVRKGEKIPEAKTKAPLPGDAPVIESASAREAIKLYQGLLEKYPLYERNDQVLYQLSRAFEETGQIEVAMKTLATLIAQYPNSRHIDEAYFRRAEYFFSRKKYLDAEEEYGAVIKIGVSSAFYELSLYKRGWALFKQELYEMALDDFITMLDYKLAQGYDFNQTSNKLEKKRIDDTYRVISLSFSYLGGADSIVAYFDKRGPRIYEPSIYSHLGEYFLDKRRYNDAALAYNTYVERNPFHQDSPHFSIRVIEIYFKGGFPKLVIESKKNFATTYGLNAEYWLHHDIKSYPTVLTYLKTNLVDLAHHFHALYQNKRLKKHKAQNYDEAIHWYRAYLESFPQDEKASEMNYQLAGLMLENKDFGGAAVEYERTAYDYPRHKDSSEAGYAAVYAYREHLKGVAQARRPEVKKEIIRSSIRFAQTFPEHKDAALILSAAADDLYAIKDYEAAIRTARMLLEDFPQAEPELQRAGWLVIAHASFDTANYVDAEGGYTQVLALTAADDKSREKLTENLAASIYKQGEQARKLEDHKTAAHHFLRIGKITPNASIRPTADYDGAAALIALKDWGRSAEVLESFRKNYPKHELQSEITKKLAIVYKEDGKLLLAAAEFERIEQESKDEDVRREALLEAAELYEKAEARNKALAVYQRFVLNFPYPIEFALETRQKIADIHKANDDHKKYIAELKRIVKADKTAGKERTDRTQYLGASAALVLAEPTLEKFTAIKLKKPFKKNLNKKKKQMKITIDTYSDLIEYGVGDVTAAATYYLAEIYYHFSRALMESERPDNLSALELEQYELVLEEQAFPFEEKAIGVHEKNMELLGRGVYNEWIDKSIAKLAKLVPARYAKAEQGSGYMENITPQAEQPAADNNRLKQVRNGPEAELTSI